MSDMISLRLTLANGSLRFAVVTGGSQAPSGEGQGRQNIAVQRFVSEGSTQSFILSCSDGPSVRWYVS